MAAIVASRGVASEDVASDAAHVSRYFFRNVGAEVGLIAPSVTTALQTADGYLWVGTQGGLARFDGVRPVIFRVSNTPAMLSDYVRCLYEDSNGTLWIGTDRGLLRYRNGTFERVGLDDSIVTAVVRDRAGTFWAGTYRNGLYEGSGDGQWQKHGRELLPNSPMPNPSISCLFVDSADRLWMGFSHDSGVICHEGGKFSYYNGSDKPIGRVQAIAEFPRGTLWIGTRSDGLVRVRGDETTYYSTVDGLGQRQINALLVSQNGGLWIVGTSLQLLTDADQFTLTTVDRISRDGINGLIEDHEHNAWLWGGDGLVRMRQLPFEVLSPNGRYPGTGLRTITEDGEGVAWAVDQDHHIYRMTRSGVVTSVRLPDSATGEPQEVIAMRDGSVVAVNGSIYARKDNAWQEIFPQMSNDVHGLFEDRTGCIWIGTMGKGIWRWDHQQLSEVMDGSSRLPSTATTFAEGPDGTMWIGLWQGGLAEVKNGKLTRHIRATGFPGDEVRAVCVDSAGYTWVGIKGRGVAVLDHGKWLNPQPLCEAVANNVTAIIEDDGGRVWLGTPGGLMWAPRDELMAIARGTRAPSALHVVGSNDGSRAAPIYSGPQPVVWKTRDHKLLFASRDGGLLVDPEHLPINATAPPVHVERVLIDRHAAALSTPVVAKAENRDIAIEYTALSYVQPSRVLFKYQLEGYDSDWVDAGNRRTAYYNNLPPGSYTFRVQACNADGVWNTTGASIALIQEPHFYETAWFYTGALATIGLMAFGLHRWRTTRLRLENERLEEGIAERTKELELASGAILERSRELELASNAKSEFLESVSHEIRNPLNGLNGLLGLLQQERLGGAARELSESVQACARGLTRVFEDVLSFARLEHGNITSRVTVFALRPLINELVQSFAWHAKQQRNVITIHWPDEFADGFEGDAGKIKTIVSNFIGNAIKYAPGSAIEVVVEQHGSGDTTDEIYVEVRDHGPGIPEAEQELIFKKFVRGSNAREGNVAGTGLGLAMCRVLATALNGSIGVESALGQGATFYLCVPLERTSLPPEMPTGASAAMVGQAGRMLIVDDERYNQVVLRGAAIELGFECEVAGTAEEAIERLKTEAFGFVLLDWELPGTKGDAVARWLRAQPGTDQTIVIATTAHDSDEVRRACAEVGMDEFLQKPYDAAEIGRCLQRARQKRQEQTNGSVLNFSALRLYARGDSASAAASAHDFLATFRQTRDELAVAIDRRDAAAIDQAAHRLRGLAGLVGARELVAAVRQFEVLARQGSPDDLRGAFGVIMNASAAVEAQVLCVN